MKRTDGQLMGFLLVTVAMVVAAMWQLAPMSADANGTSLAPAGESRYSVFAQATVRPTSTPANNSQRIAQLERRVATLEAYRAADIQRIMALELAVFGAPPPTMAPPTVTPIVTPTATPRPTATVTPTPGPTVTPTPTLPPHVGGFDCSIPANQRNYICGAEITRPPAVIPTQAGQVCPAWVHDTYLASAYQDAAGEWITRPANSAGLAGHEVVWRTWHPNVDAATGCHFTHEHGWAWDESAAMTGPPAFGLIGCLHWLSHGATGDNHCTEPHEGFKAFRVDAGFYEWFEGATAQHHNYYVLHFGTSGSGRLTQSHHSFEVWQSSGKLGDPWRVHVAGMADFGKAGNICERDAGLLGRGNRVLFEDPAQSTCAANSAYEIWFADVPVYVAGTRDPVFTVGASSASFGPATMYRDANGRREVVPTGDYGCRREGYHEAGRYQVYDWGIESAYTDVLGQPMQAGAFGGTLQVFELPREKLSGSVGSGSVAMATFDDGRRATNIIKIDESKLTPGDPFGPGIHCYANLALPN
jgi:hypothetical protein